MRKADFRKTGTLNETNIKLVFETQKHQVSTAHGFRLAVDIMFLIWD